MMDNIQDNMNRLRDKELIETEFADQMFKLIEREDKVQEVRNTFKETVRNAIFVNDQIVLITLNEAINLINTHGFSEDLMVDVFETLAKIVQMRGPHAIVTRDLNGISLFYDHRFESLINLFKYCLVYGNYISSKDIAKVLRALIKLEYKDLELQEMVQKKLLTSRYLENSNIQDSLEGADYTPEELASLPLMNKKGFYIRKKFEDFDIHMNHTFKQYVEHISSMASEDVHNKFGSGEMVSQRLKPIFLKAADMIGLKQTDPNTFKFLTDIFDKEIEKDQKIQEQRDQSKTNDPAIQEIENALERLNNLVSQEKKSLVKLSDSILKLRSLYGQLGQLQKEYFVYENASLMADLLELEESMLELGIITLADVKRMDRQGSLPNENKRLALVVKQAVHDLGGSVESLASIQQSEVFQSGGNKTYLRSEKGMYSRSLPEALASLADYAYLNTRDICIDKTYVDPTIAEVVNPDLNKERHAYKADNHPEMALRELFFDPLVDKRKLTTASPVYTRAAVSFNNFINELGSNSRLALVQTYRGHPLQLLHLSYAAHRAGNSNLISQLNGLLDSGSFARNIKIDHFCSYFFETSGNPMSMLMPGKDINSFAVLTGNLIETVEDFENKSVERKTNFLYSFALMSQLNNTLKELFKNFYTRLLDEPSLLEEMCSNYNHHWIPVPVHISKLQMVDFIAQSLDLPQSPSIKRMLTELEVSHNMSSGVEDNRDPVYNSLKDLIKNIFGFSVDSTTQVLFKHKVLAEALPLAEVFTKFNYSVFLYLGDSTKFPDGKQITIKTELESLAMQSYFSKVLGRNIKIINIPHSVFLKNGGKLNEQGKLDLIDEEKLAVVIKNIYETVLNSAISSRHRNSLMLLAQDQASRNVPSHCMSINWFEGLTGFLKALTISLEKSAEQGYKVADGFTTYVQDLRNALNEFETTNMQDVSQVLDSTEGIKLTLYKIAHGIGRSSAGYQRSLLSLFGNLKLPKLISRLIELNENIADWSSEFSYSARREGILNPPIFAGRRQGLDLIDAHSGKESAPKDLKPIEYFNYELLKSPNFFSYDDWKAKVTTGLPIWSHLGDLSKIYSGAHGQIVHGLNPGKLSNVTFIHPASYALQWQQGSFMDLGEERYAFAETAVGRTLEELPHQQRGPIAYMLALDSLKFAAKARDNLSDLLDDLSSLDLYRGLLRHFVSSRSASAVGKSLKANLARVLNLHRRLDRKLKTKSKQGLRLASRLQSEADQFIAECKLKEEKDEKRKLLLEGRTWGFDGNIVDKNEGPTFGSQPSASFDLSDPIAIKPSTTVLSMEAVKDETKLSGRKAIKTKLRKFNSSSKDGMTVRRDSLEGQALLERNQENQRDKEQELKSREEAREIFKEHRKKNAASRHRRVTRGLKTLEEKVAKRKHHSFFSTLKHFDQAIYSKAASTKAETLTRDPSAYEQHIFDIRSGNIHRKRYLDLLEGETKLQETVEYWRNMVHKIIPRMYRVSKLNKAARKSKSDMKVMYGLMKDAKRNYLLAMNAAYSKLRDDGTSFQMQEIRGSPYLLRKGAQRSL